VRGLLCLSQQLRQLGDIHRNPPLAGWGTITGLDILERVLEHSAPLWAGANAPPLIEEILMALYELRTYTLRVGAMAEAVKLYQELGFPALRKGGHDKHLVGYFQADTGTINQIVHLWKFEDDADRRAHWAVIRSVPISVLPCLRQISPSLSR
jgi:hypothetical protein